MLAAETFTVRPMQRILSEFFGLAADTSMFLIPIEILGFLVAMFVAIPCC